MKLIAIIFSIYFLGLSFIPCNDSVVDENDVTVEIVNGSDQHFDNQHLDLCSPFCSCQCCHVDVVDMELYPYKLILPVISKLDNSGVVSSTQEVNYSFLRPPRA